MSYSYTHDIPPAISVTHTTIPSSHDNFAYPRQSQATIPNPSRQYPSPMSPYQRYQYEDELDSSFSQSPYRIDRQPNQQPFPSSTVYMNNPSVKQFTHSSQINSSTSRIPRTSRIQNTSRTTYNQYKVVPPYSNDPCWSYDQSNQQSYPYNIPFRNSNGAFPQYHSDHPFYD